MHLVTGNLPMGVNSVIRMADCPNITLAVGRESELKYFFFFCNITNTPNIATINNIGKLAILRVSAITLCFSW